MLFFLKARPGRSSRECLTSTCRLLISIPCWQTPNNYTFEGESRELTVLFSDIRSFTTISEALTASELKTLLNDFFTPITEIIFENNGTIDKYVGDMVMAFWGGTS